MGNKGHWDQEDWRTATTHMARFELLAYIDALTVPGKPCRLSVAQLAAEIGVNTRTYRRYLNWLAENGWVTLHGREQTGPLRVKEKISVNYDNEIGGVTVEDWLIWNQHHWLRGSKLVSTNRSKLRFRKKREFLEVDRTRTAARQLNWDS